MSEEETIPTKPNILKDKSSKSPSLILILLILVAVAGGMIGRMLTKAEISSSYQCWSNSDLEDICYKCKYSDEPNLSSLISFNISINPLAAIGEPNATNETS